MLLPARTFFISPRRCGWRERPRILWGLSVRLGRRSAGRSPHDGLSPRSLPAPAGRAIERILERLLAFNVGRRRSQHRDGNYQRWQRFPPESAPSEHPECRPRSRKLSPRSRWDILRSDRLGRPAPPPPGLLGSPRPVCLGRRQVRKPAPRSRQRRAHDEAMLSQRVRTDRAWLIATLHRAPSAGGLRAVRVRSALAPPRCLSRPLPFP